MEKPSPNRTIGIGQTVYLVESCRRVREAVVRSRGGGLYTVRFTDTSGGIRVRADRLYPTHEAAQAALRQKKAEAQPIKPAPGWHNVALWQC